MFILFILSFDIKEIALEYSAAEWSGSDLGSHELCGVL